MEKCLTTRASQTEIEIIYRDRNSSSSSSSGSSSRRSTPGTDRDGGLQILHSSAKLKSQYGRYGRKCHSQPSKTKGHNILRSKRGFSQPEVATARGQRPEHFKSHHIKITNILDIDHVAAAAATAAAAVAAAAAAAAAAVAATAPCLGTSCSYWLLGIPAASLMRRPHYKSTF